MADKPAAVRAALPVNNDPGRAAPDVRPGALIVGDSGVGKSESALELICRGHRFVTDDVVQIVGTPAAGSSRLAPAVSRFFMEIRGLGIINIRRSSGRRSIALAVAHRPGRPAEEMAPRLRVRPPRPACPGTT